jgi:peptide deformylase
MLLDVLQFPDSQLREEAKPVQQDDVTPELRELAENMAETMYDEPGIGLAATQVGVSVRLIVMDVDWPDEGERNLRMLLNPEIVHAEGKQVLEEGCLSVPDFTAEVERAAGVTVRGRSLDWEELEFEAEGLEAACFQHEIDHLDGKLFIDRISRLKRNMYVQRRKKQIRRGEEPTTTAAGSRL